MRKHPDAICEECPLQRRPMVPTDVRGADGPVDVFWVGEAPAANEVVQGYGFVGDSGQLLWQVGGHEGLKRSVRAAVGNSVLCRPIGKNPGAKEIECCRPRLMKEIEQYDPKIVAVLGNYAWASIFNQPISTTRITQERGRLVNFNTGAGKQVNAFGTLHPAALLYNADGYFDFARDIESIAAFVRGDFTGTDEDLPETELIATVGELSDFLYTIKHDYKFRDASRTEYAELEAAADLETGGFDYSVGGDEILCLSMSFDSKVGYVVVEEVMANPAAVPALREMFNHDEIHWTWQNGTFDAEFLERDIGTFPIQHDTLLLHYAVDERRGTHSLERISLEYENAPNYKHVIDPYLKTKDSSYREIPRDILYKYAAYDAVYTRRLRFTLEKLAKDGS